MARRREAARSKMLGETVDKDDGREQTQRALCGLTPKLSRAEGVGLND
jgi:hypothetical protein